MILIIGQITCNEHLMVFFVCVLQTNTSITKLNLRDNWIGAEGAGYVAEMLSENCYISDLVCITCNVSFVMVFVKCLKVSWSMLCISIKSSVEA